MTMKIQESSASQLVSASDRSATGCFAGRAISCRDVLAEPVPLAAALRRTLTLSRTQEQMLDRLLIRIHQMRADLKLLRGLMTLDQLTCLIELIAKVQIRIACIQGFNRLN